MHLLCTFVFEVVNNWMRFFGGEMGNIGKERSKEGAVGVSMCTVLLLAWQAQISVASARVIVSV